VPSRIVIVTTPSRLHLGLIDLNGSIGRVDGSVGLAIQSPSCVLEATFSEHLRVEAADSVRQRVEPLVARLQREWGVGNAELRFRETIPEHYGFGSGTQTTLAVITALSRLYDVPLQKEEIARLSGRGGTSGIGVYAFFEGGFLVDGGHRFPQSKAAFLPSAASSNAGVGPLLFRRDFPDWEIVLVVPDARRVSGEEEVRLFQTRCPLSRASAERICHRLVMGVLPALAEENLNAFGKALESFQKVGWKQIEIAAQDKSIRQTMRFLRERGASGVAMSSWGPVVIGFYESKERSNDVTAELALNRRFRGRFFTTRANNRGAEVTVNNL
jgi:beta-ribofuranosylaminobenzene 5'-phosphate synthase